jgi:tetratricopeptide (TPR) repeat protein
MRASRKFLVLLCVVAAAACASRRSVPPRATTSVPPTAPPVDVAALVRHGCFRCLEEALAAAEGEQAFEVTTLLVLRAKELGLPYSEYRRQAAAIAPPDPAYATYLDVVDALPVDVMTGERYLRDPTTWPIRIDRDAPGAPVRVPTIADRAAGWREILRTGPGSDVFKRYLDLAIGCSLVPRTPQSPAVELTPDEHDVPLLRYRFGLCGIDPRDLRALRDSDPAFVDADFTLGRIAMSGRPADLDEGLRWMQSAHEAFPESLPIAISLGAVYDDREEWSESLNLYDAVIAQMPVHRDALLGRAVALSHLARHEEAVAAASRMINLGEWLMGEAYYWRAWNEFSLQQYLAAREDTDRAKSRMINAAVFVLSGLVEWNFFRLPTAESELEEALKMDFGRCDAARYLGRVRAQRNNVPGALAAFKQAIQCFDLSITVRQKLIADIQAGPGSEATRNRLAAGHQRAIDAAVADREECRQNVAAFERRGTQ